MSLFAYIYQQSVAHAFTICGICGIFAVTLIWIVQHYLQVLVCPVISIVVIHVCMVSLTMTSQGFNIFRIDWPIWWQSLHHLREVFHCFVPVIDRQLGSEYYSRSVCWSTKTCVKNSLFNFTPCLLHHSHPVHWDRTTVIVSQSLGSRLTQLQELFTFVVHLFGTTCHCVSVQTFQLLRSRNIWRHISWTRPFPT